jgi:hypothetical protein
MGGTTRPAGPPAAPPVLSAPTSVAPFTVMASRLAADHAAGGRWRRPARARPHRGRYNWAVASTDIHSAVDLMDYFVSERQLPPYTKWMWARTEDLVEAWWPQIEAVAAALLERRTMHAQEIRKVMASVVTSS